MRKLWIGGAQACQGRDKLCKWTNNMLHEITDT
jgi:Zn ribbon nucleic-acid-binding protein